MTLPIDSSRGVLYVKAQAGVGTGATITQTDLALRVIGRPQWTVEDALEERGDVKSPTGVGPRPLLGAARPAITLTTEVYPLAAYNALPTGPYGALLRSCFDVAAVTYDTADAIRCRFGSHTARIPCTVEWHDLAGGNRYRAIDCVGIARPFADEAGARLRIEWTLQGRYDATPEAATAFTAAAVDFGTEVLPVRFCGVTVTSGIRRADNVTEQTIRGLSALELAYSGQVVQGRDATQGAYRCAAVPRVYRSEGYDTLTMTVDAGSEADTADGLRAWATWRAQAAGRALLASLNQGAGGVRIDVRLPAATYRAPEIGDEAQQTYTLVGLAHSDQATPNEGAELYFLAGA
jgi:hypothetical protein